MSRLVKAWRLLKTFHMNQESIKSEMNAISLRIDQLLAGKHFNEAKAKTVTQLKQKHKALEQKLQTAQASLMNVDFTEL